MRIAYLCSDFGIPVFGSKGASIHVRELSGALAALGHDLMILTPRVGGDRPAGFAVPVCELPLDPADRTTYGLLQSEAGAGEAVAKEVRSLLYVASLRYRALEELRRFDPHIIYERYSLFGTAGLALSRALGVPLLLEVNAPLSEEQAAHRQLAFGEAARGLESEVLCSADGVIAVSQELGRWLAGVGVAPERVTVMANGVDVGRFGAGALERDRMRRMLGLTGKQVVGFAGTLKAWHGVETLVRAVAMLHGRGLAPHLLVVGEGPERGNLMELAGREGIRRAVTFTGAAPHEEMPAYVAAMDVATAPYAHTEGFYFSPLKLFEYMAAGRPVVAADAGQIHECVRHGETGWLYPPGNVEALADSIAALLRDPSAASSLGRAGQEYVSQRHTWEQNARTVAATAERLVSSLQEVR